MQHTTSTTTTTGQAHQVTSASLTPPTIEAQYAAMQLFNFIQACANAARWTQLPSYLTDDDVYQLAAEAVRDVLSQPNWRNVAALSIARQAGQWAYLTEAQRS